MSWRRVQVAHLQCPQKRAFNSINYSNGAIFLFGGADKKKRFGDTWRLDLRQQIPSLIFLAAQKVRLLKTQFSCSKMKVGYGLK